jgi:hypothetical protein
MLGENKRTNTNSPGPHARDVGYLTNITSYSDTPVVPPLRAGDFRRVSPRTVDNLLVQPRTICGCSFGRANTVFLELPMPFRHHHQRIPGLHV